MLDLALKGTLSEWMNPIAKHKSSKKLWELKELGEILDKRRIYIYIYIYENNIYENNEVKSHGATRTRSTAYKPMALNNFIVKYKLDDQLMDNIVADIYKKLTKLVLLKKKSSRKHCYLALTC